MSLRGSSTRPDRLDRTGTEQLAITEHESLDLDDQVKSRFRDGGIGERSDQQPGHWSVPSESLCGQPLDPSPWA